MQQLVEGRNNIQTIDDATYQKIYPTAEVTPRFYATPKIHKKDNPVRPIVSGINSITYELAKHLAKLLKPLVGKTKYHIQNSQHLVKLLKGITLEKDDTLVSFDVSALFTSVPCDEVVGMCVNRCQKDTTWASRTALTPEDMGELLAMTLDTTYFQYKGKFYQQTYGAAMGSPLSPVIANIFMEEFEMKALQTTPNPPKFWGRYVDDTGVVSKKTHVQALFEHINAQHQSIHFTIEEENVEGSLPMLDVKMTKDKERIKTTVYRKATNTDHYLQWSSHHPTSQKLSVPASLFHRCETVISDTEDKQTERKKIEKDLLACGYPKWALKQGEKRGKNRHDKEKDAMGLIEGAKQSIVLPYCQGLSEKLSRVYKKYNIKLHHKPGWTLRQALVKPKDPLTQGEQCGVIYSVKCGTCQGEYIGETGRPLATRMKEHKDSVAKNNWKSALGEHTCKHPGHHIDFDSLKVIDRENWTFQRKIAEAVHIRTKQPDLNRQGGYDLPAIYLTVLQRDAEEPRGEEVTVTTQGQ
ncbi:uncharacterized protein LOC106174656 [Lingula anatina]|uniref:Uncharacterized protein LOC106174656 n=1 Tax=Lingula anatina TaxID=7574 RepID=A0A1S3JN34_LINAN|nr:uncharacterized protein LOC106174656 [Lingula anatina]|eukprot:XP_013411770.1 uncharacterized protein LOC106174656 [Lingula anatina]